MFCQSQSRYFASSPHGESQQVLLSQRSPGAATECGICLGKIAARGRLPCCDHRFCFDCITQWAKVVNTCPLCKARFREVTRVEAGRKAMGHRRRGCGGGGGSSSSSSQVPSQAAAPGALTVRVEDREQREDEDEDGGLAFVLGGEEDEDDGSYGSGGEALNGYDSDDGFVVDEDYVSAFRCAQRKRESLLLLVLRVCSVCGGVGLLRCLLMRMLVYWGTTCTA